MRRRKQHFIGIVFHCTEETRQKLTPGETFYSYLSFEPPFTNEHKVF